MMLSRSSLTGTSTKSPELIDLQQIISTDNTAQLSQFLHNNPDELSEVTLDGKSLLMRLIASGAKRCAEYILKTFPTKCNTDKQDTSGATALHLAAKEGFTSIVRLLPCNDQTLVLPDRNSMTALHIATEKGHEAIVEHFCTLSLSDDTKQRLFQQNTVTPLHLAVKTSYVSLSHLLRIAPDKNVVDQFGKTALHYAVESDIADDCVLTLTTANVNVNAVDRNGNTPLILAIKRKSTTTIHRLFSKNADPNLGRIHPLIHAFLQNSEQLFLLLIERGAKPELAVLYSRPLVDILVAIGEISFLKILNCSKFSLSLELRKDETIKDTLENDKLVEFCYLLRSEKRLLTQYPTLLHTATLKGNTIAIQLLIQHGFDPNWQDENGNSSLFYASSEEIIDLLLQQGADIERKNKQGQTPLQSAYETGKKAAFIFLLQKGANVDALDRNGNTLLEQCVQMGNYNDSKLLVEHGASRRVQSLFSAIVKASPELTELLISMPIFYQNRHIHVVDPNKTLTDITPLVLAIEMLYQKISKEVFTNPSIHHKSHEMGGYVIFQRLLQEGASVNASSAHVTIRNKQVESTAEKTSPLIVASERNLADIVRELLNNGAIPKKVNGKHPVIICAENNFLDSLHELLSHGAKIPKKAVQNINRYTLLVQNMLQEHMPKSRSLSKRFEGLKLTSSKQQTSLTPAVTLDVRKGTFYKADVLQETVLREKNIVSGTALLFKHSRFFPGSMCRLAGSMDIKIEGVPVINKSDVYPEGSSRDQKAFIIVSKILQPIHHILGLRLDATAFKERVELMSKMDSIDETKIQALDIYKNKALQKCNEDMIALRLIAKEAALMAVLPVQMQIRNYAEKHTEVLMRPFMRDQWEEIDITRKNNQFETYGKTTIGIGAATDASHTITTSATVQIDAKLVVNHETGNIEITIMRSNLTFKENVPLKLQGHILSALEGPIV